MLKLVYW